MNSRKFRVLATTCLLTIAALFQASAADLPADFDLFGGVAPVDEGREVDIVATIERGADGKPDSLAVTATIADGWHVYSITQPKKGPTATTITIADDSPRKATGGFSADPLPHVRTDHDIQVWKGLALEEHEARVTWRAPLAAGSGGVKGTIRFQLCKDGTCLPPQTVSFAAGIDSTEAVSSGAGKPAATYSPDQGHVTVEVEFGEPTTERAVDAIPVIVKLVPADAWHLYKPADSAVTKAGQGKPTIVGVTSGSDRVLGVSVKEATPARDAKIASSGAVEGPIALELLLSAGIQPVEVLVGYHTCSDDNCDPMAAVRLAITLPTEASSGTVEFAPAKYGAVAQDPLSFQQQTKTSTSTSSPKPFDASPALAPAASTSTPSDAAAISLPWAVLMGLAGGLILNLMPCVLPVLGLKLMSFAQQSGRARQEVFQLNLWYCAGLFAVFGVLATAAVAANIGLAQTNLAWGQQFGSVPFKIGMLGLVFAFALSFLGVWELPIPGFIGEKAGQVQSQEGPLGAFLKGVLSTVLATPCSGPFLGPVFTFTLTQPTVITYVIFGSIALGMASPYILVGMFPRLVRFLPKPGAWMETFKEILGFVMLGTVAFLFFQLQKQPEYFVPTFVMLIGIWMGCWWVGRIQSRFGIAAFGHWLQGTAIAAAIGLGAILWLGPADSPTREALLPILRPVRTVFRNAGPLDFLASFLPSASPIDWEPFSLARVRELQRDGNTVMVDFSADWCATCKINLQGAIETETVHAVIKKNRVVPVLADWTDGSSEIQEALAKLGSRSIPLLAIFPGAQPGEPPRKPIVLRDLLSERQVIDALEAAGPSCCPPPEIRAASVPGGAGR